MSDTKDTKDKPTVDPDLTADESKGNIDEEGSSSASESDPPAPKKGCFGDQPESEAPLDLELDVAANEDISTSFDEDQTVLENEEVNLAELESPVNIGSVATECLDVDNDEDDGVSSEEEINEELSPSYTDSDGEDSDIEGGSPGSKTASWGELRRREIEQVFGISIRNYPDSKTWEVWAEELQQFLDVTGWVAVSPRGKCIVEHVDFETFTAFVEFPKDGFGEILSEDENEGEDPELKNNGYSAEFDYGEFSFPLQVLHVCNKQPQGIDFLKQQAKASLRSFWIFKNFLEMPGDTQNSKKWISRNLKMRLKMYDDLMDGVIPEDQANEIMDIVLNLRKNQIRLDSLSLKDDLPVHPNVDSDSSDQYEIMQRGLDADQADIMALGMEQTRLENFMKRFEQPAMREFAYRHQYAETHGISLGEKFEEKVLLVSNSGVFNTKDMAKFLDLIKADLNISDSNIRIVKSLGGAALGCSNNTVIYIPEGTYHLTGLGNLESGGKIVGLGRAENTVLKPRGAGDIWLKVLEGKLWLKNLTLVIQPTKPRNFFGVLVGTKWRSPNILMQISPFASTAMENIILEGLYDISGVPDENRTVGVHVMHDGNLNAVNVDIRRFTNGIICDINGTGVLRECGISLSKYGLQVQPGANSKGLEVVDSSIHTCEYGALLKCEIGDHAFGELELLLQQEYPITGTCILNCATVVALEARDDGGDITDEEGDFADELDEKLEESVIEIPASSVEGLPVSPSDTEI